MERNDVRRPTALTLILIIALLSLVAVALATNVAAVDVWTNNENSGQSRWLESDDSIGPVHIWKTDDTTNVDWFKFNASEGEHVEIKFRKYTRDPHISELPGYTYYIKWDLWGPFVPGRNVYAYTATYPRQGGPREYHMRDTFSMMVEKNLGGIYFIHVYVDPPQDEEREFAYYWLNLTVDPVLSLDTQQSYSGVMAQYNSYNVNFNFEDVYSITLDATKGAGDMVTVTITKSQADHQVFVEAWSEIPFGRGHNDHMLNRTYFTGTTIRIEFIAPSPGTYFIKVFRYFYSHGLTDYNIGVFVTSMPVDGDNQAQFGTPIPKAQTETGMDLEMGYDTHDWYQCQIVAGDKKFHVTLDLLDPNLGDGHGIELTVYSGNGQMMWTVGNRYRLGENWAWRDTLELPPQGTTTIFDEDEIYYVRVSVDPTITASGVAGFSTRYDIVFDLANRAPVLEVPFEDLYEWDEDGSTSIELDSHFSDVDGDPMEYTIFNKTTGFVVDNNGLDNGYLNITSPADWNGEVWWRLRAVDRGGGENHYINVELKLRVNPVADRPMTNESLSASCVEEGTASVDLNDLFYDVDEGRGGLLTFGLYDTGITEVDVNVDPHSGMMLMVPTPDVFGTFTFDVWCHDDLEEYIMEEVELTVRPVNDIPHIVGPIPALEMDEGDTVAREIDLEPYFVDVDGDDLLYTYDVPLGMRNFVSVIHKNNVVTENTLVIKVLDAYFYATFPINITCTDPDETTVQQDLVVDITPIPNAPEILYTPVGNPSNIDETQTLFFEVTDVLDHDLPEMGLHTYTWFLDEILLEVNTSTYIYEADYDSADRHTVEVIVTDPSGLTASANWAFDVTNVNRKPMATITTLPTALEEGETITLSVDASDPDSDELTITWYRVSAKGDKVLGTGAEITTTLDPGTVTIEVQVIDPHGEKAIDVFSIEVKAIEEESDLGMLLGIVVAVVILIVIALVYMRMRSSVHTLPPEARMDIESLDRGYDPSSEQTPDYGDEYNPSPQYDEEYDRLQ
jgi:hypothetical protein